MLSKMKPFNIQMGCSLDYPVVVELVDVVVALSHTLTWVVLIVVVGVARKTVVPMVMEQQYCSLEPSHCSAWVDDHSYLT